jgi:hypothetical protein
MMKGPRQARHAITEFLADRIPARTVAYRNEWNKSSSELPDPQKYMATEPMALDKWPTVITVCLNTRSIARDTDSYDGDPSYDIIYEMRTYIWVKANGSNAVTDMRDDVTTVVRDLLLDHPSIDSGDCGYFVEESTMREEFSDLTSLGKGDRIMAGAFIAYEMRSTETLERDVLGILGIQGVTLTVDMIDPVPNAPTRVRVQDAGSGSVTATWQESTWEGGKVYLTAYKVESSTDGGTNWTTVVADTGSREGAATVTGLTIGESYIFRVAGFNSEGTGASSASSNEVTLA